MTVLATNASAHHSAQWYQGFDPTNQSLTGLLIAMLAIGVLGVLAVTGEYGTGDHPVVAVGDAPPSALLSWPRCSWSAPSPSSWARCSPSPASGSARLVLSAGGAPTAALGQPGVLRAVMLSGAFLSLLALLGLGLGLDHPPHRRRPGRLRRAHLPAPLLLQRLPSNPTRFTPIPILANSVSAVVRQSNQVSAPVGFALMVLYAVVVLAVGTALIVRRDA